MTDLARALSDLETVARKVSATTSGKVNREAFPKPARLALAELDGALARLVDVRRLEQTNPAS